MEPKDKPAAFYHIPTRYPLSQLGTSNSGGALGSATDTKGLEPILRSLHLTEEPRQKE